MKRTARMIALGCWSLGCAAVVGQTPGVSERALLTGEVLVAQKEPAAEKKETKAPEPQPAQVDFSELPAERSEGPTGLNPHMIGDFPGLFRLVTVSVPSLARIEIREPKPPGPPPDRPGGQPGGPPGGQPGQVIFVPTTVNRTVRVPIGGGGFKIGENEGVLPQDRAFFTYNFYNDVEGPNQGSERRRVVQRNIEVEGQTFAADVLVPGVPAPRFDIQRETLGFEKSFGDGAFSVGLRVPFFQHNGAGEFGEDDLGDLTFIFKAAPYVDRQTGSGLSVGLAVTVPTGPDVETVDGNIHPTILQPFVGYQAAGDRFLLYGFTSLAVPTDDRDVTNLFNDVGLGFRLFEGDGFVSSVVPAIEAHVTTPLDHREAGDTIQGIDLVVLTGGVHFGLGGRSLLTLGVATPVTGPRPFDVEAIVQFNFRY